jgi:TP901 family phage tail tape measure protein
MVERIEGMSIGMDLDSIAVERGLTGLKDRLKTVNAEMRNQLSVFDRADKSVDKYTTIIDNLSEKIKIQEKIVASTKAEFEKMTAEYGAGSKEAEKAKRAYENQSTSLNNMKRSLTRTTDDLEKFRKEQAKQDSTWTKMSNGAKDYAKKLDTIAEKTKTVGDGLTTGLTVPLVGISGLLLKQASDAESSQARVQTALGLTTDEAKQLSDAITNVYEAGWGESFDNVEETAKAVVTQLGYIDDPQQLSNIIKNAQMLADTFGMDTNEALRGVNALMETYGMTAEEAFDYMTVGAQNGLDKTQELGDNLSEYAPLLADAGYEADEMFAALQAGLDAGAYNLDKVNDLIKEFSIRVGDGTIKTAVEEMGGEWQSLYDTWEASGGTVDELFRLLGDKLAGIKDPMEKQNALTTIWGSLGEDAGAKVVEAVAGATDSYNDVNGAAKNASDTMEQTFGERFQSLMREAGDSLLPIGNTLMDMAEDYLPKLDKAVQETSEWIAGLDEDTVQLAIGIGGVLLVAGPTLSLLANGVTIISGLAGAFSATSAVIAGAGGFTALMTGTILPIGATLAAITGLTWYMNQDAFQAFDGFGNKVSDTTDDAVTDYINMSSETTTELDLMFIRQEEITDEKAAVLTGKFDSLYGTIKKAAEDNFTEQTTILTDFFAETGVLTDENETNILAKMQENYLNRETALNEYNDRATEIVNTANEENRSLTQAEYDELAYLQKIAQDYALTELSASEEEQLVLRETMSQMKDEIDAETAANTVKRSMEARDQVIADANTKYEEVVAAAIYQRDEMGTLTAEEADKIIAEAGRQRDGAVEKAQNMHSEVIKAARAQSGEHVNEVNWATGEIMSKWDTMMVSIVNGMWNLPGKMGNALSGQSWRVQNAIQGMMNAGITKVEKGVNSMIRAMNVIFEALDSDISFSRVTLPRVGFSDSPSTQQSGNMAYANGTGIGGHPGGPAIVGDGGMKELIALPSGEMFMSPDTDTMIDLPKGTQVFSGPDTKQFMNAIGIPKYANGIGSKIWEWLGNGAESLLNNTLGALGLSAPSKAGNFGNLANSAFNMIKNESISFLGNKIDDFFASFTGPLGGGASAWAPIVQQAASMMGESISGSELAGILAQIQRESGGNQKIIQSSAVVDVNTLSGNPAKGLLQYIPQTFAAYAVPGHNNIFSGLDQLLAFFNNTNWRNDLPYGQSGWGPSGATKYATGGLVNHGLYELGEEGYPEWIIPTNPGRRSQAMKLLALANKDVQGNARPEDFGNVGSAYDTSVDMTETNELLKALINMVAQGHVINADGKAIADVTYGHITNNLQRETNRTSIMNMKGGLA